MADYRFSAQVISRGKGQSSVASAAYRSASRLVDERTGEIHDYGRKGGLVHSEVLTPEGTPEWMADRAQLWNAVESVERRKDAQLAREVQLSLPHELDQESRKRLVLDFVQEQFVDRGMIADIAIHAPSAKGDDRNHHAHVMLTMRELTADGFGNKQRDWNSPEMLEQWREKWAHHQNRALERHGHQARVDHRSFEAQGVDREPQQHLGPTAADMERNGKASRIGDENRAIANDNSDRARDHAESARLASEIAREKWKFGQWAEYKRREISAAQKLADLDLDQKHHREKLKLETEIKRDNGTARATIKAELEAIDKRLQAKGVTRVLRDVFGRTRTDTEARQQMQASLSDIKMRETERRQSLEVRQEADRAKEATRQADNRKRLEKGVEIARERREATNWKPRDNSPQSEPKASSEPVRAKFARQAEPENKPLDEPTLAEKKTLTGHAPEKSTDKSLRRPWESQAVREGNKRPWESDLVRGGRTGRKPDPTGGKF